MDKEKQERKRNLRLVDKFDSDDYSRYAAPDYADVHLEDNLHYLNTDQERLENSGISGATEEEIADKGFRGVGPKGYKRSDEKIYEDVCESLMRHRAIDASHIIVKVTDGTVYLSGKIESRGLKKLAESVAENISGVKEVTNELSVIRGELRMDGPEGVTQKDLGIT
ncbi:BON domain-containing protein [Peredibacter starrii]|uniref:BON domain-containing protein n=1 Tax=Peredibacter starrii TaxID=28202 RepID=A0AAX4HVF1_9BACT|nr:BON domain-containing protein [Peredibacter starrii]WPU66961.1 BON domain-containing protein [Peredibacter starrii]